MSEAGGRWLGYLEAVAAASLWATSGIFSVTLFRMGVPPESLALLRPVVGALILAAGLLLWRADSLKISRRGLLVLGVGGGAIVGAFQMAYQLSTDAVGVPTTVALLYVSPAIVAAVCVNPTTPARQPDAKSGRPRIARWYARPRGSRRQMATPLSWQTRCCMTVTTWFPRN